MAQTDAERIAELEAENTRLKRGEATQLSRDDIKGMDPLAIDRARRDGRLRDIMSTPDPNARTDGYRTKSGTRKGEPLNSRDFRPAGK